MADDWKIVLVSTLPQDIYLAQSFLESEEIPTLLKDELTAQVNNFYSNAIGGVKLLVPSADFERALMLLKEAGYVVEQDARQALPVETVRTSDRSHCPYCGSENIAKKKDADWLVLLFYAFLGAIFPIFKPVYTCFDCRRNWRFRKP